MIMTSKRKLTSGVAILCAFMILMGIFPMNLFTVGKAEAASDAKYQSGYIYFDISNIVNAGDSYNKSEWIDGIYMSYYGGSWSGFSDKFTRITDTIYGIDVSTWNNKDNSGQIIFMTKNDWTQIKSADYRRTNLSEYNVNDAQLKVFSWNGETESINNKQAFKLTSRTVVPGEYIEQQSLQGKQINFKDMTGKLTEDNITATFTTDNGTGSTPTPVTGGQVTIPPDDPTNGAYTTVEFKSGETSLGKYNLFGTASTGVEAVTYAENTCDTFYYGATEKFDDTKISYWGAIPSSSSTITSQKLYLDDSSFPTSSTAPAINVNGTSGSFSVGDGENAYSYNILSVKTDDIITVIYNGTKYHFMWSDIALDMVAVSSDDIATVSSTYGSSNTIYFDATLSKLSYEGSETVANAIMPVSGGNIYCHLFGSTTGASNVTKQMNKLNSVTKGSNTWSDVYAYDLTEDEINAEYTKVVFFSSTNINTWPNDTTTAASKTVDLDFPTGNKTCFYADSSDQVAYVSGTKRSGYWDKPYTIRDAESGKTASGNSKDVVDIKKDTFNEDPDTKYVNSTFYDYYTDYELNGNNRDDYGSSTGASHRNWVNFRQFDQALSDYYKNKGVSKNDAIYTGHFQPSYGTWGYQFSAIAGTMDLYGWDIYNTFISNNNSVLDSTGSINANNGGDASNGGHYQYATQKLVNPVLDNGVLKTYDGKAASPYFDEDFLSGNNSKNTKLGEVYKNVSFPFTKKDVFGDGVEYWWYDSASKTLAMQQDTTGKYYLEDYSSSSDKNWSKNLNSTGTTTGDSVSNTYGFFPFNYGVKKATNDAGSTYNYGFGTKLELKFRLTEDGKVLDSNGNQVDIRFLFSGDDDVWVYIDGQLALDVGGDHGQVTGMLDFADKKAYVSRVKTSANNSNGSGTDIKKSVNYTAGGLNGNTTETYNFYQSSDFSLIGNNEDEHTLTMFYMERGLWESNMKVAFNFPDENQIEVEKQVDVSNVNELFKNMFNDQSIFTFNIKNYTTHYGTKVASGTDSAQTETFAENFNASNQLNKSSSDNTFVHMSSYNGQNEVVHYKALHTNENQLYTDKRLGIVKSDSGSSIDASSMTYLQFKVYCSSQLSANKMYICLTDSNGKKADGFLNGKLYGNSSTANSWSTLKVILSKLTKQNGFDFSSIASISFEYDDEVDIYLDDFIFEPTVSGGDIVGFQTNQADIPDYGSVNAGGLQNAYRAKYTSSESSTETYMIGSDGNFVLKNNETVTFRDQFRLGSYISLTENLTDVQKKLFNTSWTMYDDGIPVTNMKDGTKVTNGAVTSLKDISSYGVDDDRTEVYVPGDTANEAYTSSQKPDSNTIVFRSYSNSDSVNTSTKLKVIYNNKVKTGNLTITKAKSAKSNPLNGNFTFYIEFYNVGGVGLEDSTTLVGPITLGVNGTETITGIPVGTEYKIHEVIANDDGAVLESVSGSGTTFVQDSVTVGKNKIATNSVSGTISDESSYAYTFTNIKKPTISLNVQKKWSMSGAEMTEYRVSLKLMRSTDGNIWEEVPNLQTISLGEADKTSDTEIIWQKAITGLDKFTDDNTIAWQYKLVELDSSGNVIDDNGRYLDMYDVTYDAPTSDDNGTLTVTNTYRVQEIVMPEAGGEGRNPFNFVLFGAIAIALAGGILLLNKKYAFLHIGKSSKEVQ